MDDDRERDDVALSRLVRQFRRVARLLAADPLRLLPPDPLGPLVSLGAPIDALIGAAPLERLREAIEPAARDARRVPSRARVRPGPGGADALRPRAAAALLSADAPAGARPRNAGFPAVRQEGRVVRGTGERPRPDQPGRPAAHVRTLAERRSALRRELADAAAPRRLPSSDAALGSALARIDTGFPPIESPVSAPGRRGLAAVPASSAAARLLPARAVEPRTPPEDEIAVPMRAEASLPPPLPGIEAPASVAAHVPLGLAAAGAAREEQSAGLGLGSLSDEQARTMAASGSPTSTPRDGRRSPAYEASMAGPAEGRPRIEARPRSRSWKTETALEPSDDLFEALYRDGVDVSWP